MSIFGPGALRAADLFADEQHRRLVALAFADDDGAIEIERVERVAHRLDGGGVGGLFVAAADQLGAGDGGVFGDADHFEDENAVEGRAGGGHRGFPNEMPGGLGGLGAWSVAANRVRSRECASSPARR